MVMWGIGLRGSNEDWIKEIGFVVRGQIGLGSFAYNTETRGALETTLTLLLFWVANANEGDVENTVARNCALNVWKDSWRLRREKGTLSVIAQNVTGPRPTRFYLYAVEYN